MQNSKLQFKIQKVNIFEVGVSVTDKEGALALITQWVREYRKSITGIICTTGTTSEKNKNKTSFRKTCDTGGTFGTCGTSTLGQWPKVIVTPNPEMIVAAQKDAEFKKALNKADLAIADGTGIIAASRLLNLKFKITRSTSSGRENLKLQRITGLELMEELIKEAGERNWRVMLLGGERNAAAKAARKLQITHSTSSGRADYRLQITSSSGPQNIEKVTEEEMKELILYINSIKPDLLLVAFGHGKQEKWMVRYKSQLKVGVMMGVGGAIDQIADPSLRPPSIINSIGLGWLYRLARQPWRIKRQMALVRFVQMVIKEKIKNF